MLASYHQLDLLDSRHTPVSCKAKIRRANASRRRLVKKLGKAAQPLLSVCPSPGASPRTPVWLDVAKTAGGLAGVAAHKNELAEDCLETEAFSVDSDECQEGALGVYTKDSFIAYLLRNPARLEAHLDRLYDDIYSLECTVTNLQQTVRGLEKKNQQLRVSLRELKAKQSNERPLKIIRRNYGRSAAQQLQVCQNSPRQSPSDQLLSTSQCDLLNDLSFATSRTARETEDLEVPGSQTARQEKQINTPRRLETIVKRQHLRIAQRIQYERIQHTEETPRPSDRKSPFNRGGRTN